jgi:hypothetical protein
MWSYLLYQSHLKTAISTKEPLAISACTTDIPAAWLSPDIFFIALSPKKRSLAKLLRSLSRGKMAGVSLM